MFIERSINIDSLLSDSRFADKVKSYIKKHARINDKTIPNRLSGDETRQTSDNRTVSLIECFVRNDEGTIDQVFILDEAEIIYEEAVSLSRFPIAVYTPQRPDGNPYGHSKLNKIINTVIALNLIDSMEATQPYRLLNRVRFVNVDGRINMRSFAEYGNTPGASFEVKGDPANIIKYLDVPTIPDMSNLKSRLENSIFQITGVDPYYKGRMTNSIQTTGATQAFQARVTMLTDNSRITLLEEFCENLTRLVLEFYTLYGGETVYKVPKLTATGTNRVSKEIDLVFNDAMNVNVQDKYDIIIIDAAKGKNEAFFEKFKFNLKPNGLIITDNIEFHGLVGKSDEITSKNLRGLVSKIEKYIKFLEENKEFETSFVQIGDGLAVSKRRAENDK